MPQNWQKRVGAGAGRPLPQLAWSPSRAGAADLQGCGAGAGWGADRHRELELGLPRAAQDAVAGRRGREAAGCWGGAGHAGEAAACPSRAADVHELGVRTSRGRR